MKISAAIYLTFITMVILFQWALAIGAPWGELTMGGFNLGVLPIELRIAALGQSLLLIFQALIMSASAEFYIVKIVPKGRKAMKFVTGFSFLAVVVNLCSPSFYEKLLWVPVTIVLFISSFIVMINSKK